MTLNNFDNYLNSFLHKEDFLSDISLNGIQIQNSNPGAKEIKKVAFAVDACEETAKQAANQGADILVVHHGIFWGHCQTITGSMYKRISEFIKNDLALCAYHIPLDANNPYGNNYGLANRINLKNIKPFGSWRGMPLGVKGELENELSVQEIAKIILPNGKMPNVVLPFGNNKCKTVGIISGGGSEDIETAVQESLDCFITGDFAHEQFHYAKEMEINVIGGGHYETETIGVSLLMEKVKKELGLDCFFIDCPTNL